MVSTLPLGLVRTFALYAVSAEKPWYHLVELRASGQASRRDRLAVAAHGLQIKTMQLSHATNRFPNHLKTLQLNSSSSTMFYTQTNECAPKADRKPMQFIAKVLRITLGKG